MTFIGLTFVRPFREYKYLHRLLFHILHRITFWHVVLAQWVKHTNPNIDEYRLRLSFIHPICLQVTNFNIHACGFRFLKSKFSFLFLYRFRWIWNNNNLRFLPRIWYCDVFASSMLISLSHIRRSRLFQNQCYIFTVSVICTIY